MSVRLLSVLLVLTLFLGGCMSVGYQATETSSDSTDYVQLYEQRKAELRASQARHAQPHLLDGTNGLKPFSVRISGCFSKDGAYICVNSPNQRLRNSNHQSPGLRNTAYCQTNGKQDPRCYGYFQ